MSATCRELFRSRGGDIGTSGRRELLYSVTGTDDDAAVIAAVQAKAPSTFGGLYFDSFSIEQVGPGTWMVKCNYVGGSYSIGLGEHRFAFQIGGGSQHVSQSLATVNRTPFFGGTSPDFQGAMNVEIKNGQVNVRGVDVIAPKGEFSELHCLADAVAGAPAYQRAVNRLVGHYNAAAFRGYDIGEVLFVGADGEKGDDNLWRVTFKFQVSENRSNVTINGVNIGSVKGGEYLWCLYEEAADDAAHAMIVKPTAAYVEKVYEAGDFSVLGIGVNEL